ncbi:MAG: DUF2202 domain-containing protein [Nanoarchaeota archaeon]
MKGAKIKNTIKVVAVGLLSLGSFIGFVNAYMGQPGPNPNAPQYYTNGTANYYGQGAMVNNQFRMQGQGRMNGQRQIGQDDIVKSQTLQYVMQLPKQPLDEQEINDIEHMREEEKLARDVYLTLYNKWGLSIFKNIARSEQNHMNAVKVLIEKYNLEDPVEETGDEIGKFENPELEKLYNELVEKGSQSIKDALEVGATIEDLDIYDLEKEKVIMKLKERKRLDSQTKQEVIQIIQQALITKLEALLVEVVGTPLEDKYTRVIQDLITKAQNATSVDELKTLVMEYIKLKREINAELQVEVDNI